MLVIRLVLSIITIVIMCRTPNVEVFMRNRAKQGNHKSIGIFYML